ncbi:MAG: c-type cytochrome domain-containing protein [Verrucomicrobiota bacterium]
MSSPPSLWSGCGGHKFWLATSLALSAGLLGLGLAGLESPADPGGWVRFLGRFHPVILHLPIGALLLLALWEACLWWRGASIPGLVPVLFAAVSASLAAWLGWLLGKTGNYDTALLDRHLWGGILTAILSIWVALAKFWWEARPTRSRQRLYRGLLASTCLVMLWASHDGGSLTHGKGFLTDHAPPWLRAALLLPEREEPVEKEPSESADPVVFAELVFPIFEAKCLSCHNQEKQEGDLRMDTFAALVRGGDLGPSVVPGDVERSEFLYRIHLPLEDEWHMPPDGKLQVTAEELLVMEWWVEQGASEHATRSQLASTAEVDQAIASLKNPP